VSFSSASEHLNMGGIIMRSVLKTILILGGLLTSLFGLDRARLAGAEQETKVSHSRRGGILVAAEGHRFEVFFYPTGVRVFPLDAAGNAVDTSGLTASATVSYPGAPPERSLPRPLHPVPADTGAAPSSLVASIDLADAPEKTTTVVLDIIGLSGTTASTAAFKIPLEFVAKAAATSTPTNTPPPPTTIPPPSHARSQASALTAIVRTSSLDQRLCRSLRQPRLHPPELASPLVAAPRRMQRARA
jgi:hypothetical protein